ncbi:hypothetical protein DFH08DRAFT_844274 [Mycena albidolilacea]|uniref:Thioredoxin domain-containing protein n=1 Tax=Mycena albidolilacea TaxID=1033008 RepID=A0AAD7F0F1_9AGAR|nr:hypothetical protein DFH08DRAFT_844274 [Mycena albidolilacea]
MPLNIAEPPVDPTALLQRPEEFLIFYADIVDGKMWCSDCRAVDDNIRKTFTGSDSISPTAAIVYVGNKPNWKSLDNVFRGEPFKITDVPTIVKIREGKEVARLVDQEINSKLADFVLSNS